MSKHQRRTRGMVLHVQFFSLWVKQEEGEDDREAAAV
ncbi:hypothetical protein SLEP1_g26367 [Rubroshorea leprosula]|uniref:Uncharacterized protein n=1 Tax=Rubroshorea leprosula TaxID=152421 RepID=A0AAV5JLZ2_9ROSI|nr:hypothetical protein SLEP1_g26367 [Rubroshorea leprosula]